jgi:hypothetical protein
MTKKLNDLGKIYHTQSAWICTEIKEISVRFASVYAWRVAKSPHHG